MAEAHLVSTLERHCVALDKRVEEYRRLKAQAESDLVHLRSTIEFVERSDGVPGAKIPTTSVAHVFGRREAFALCVEALLKAGPELTTCELAEVCMREKKDLDPSDTKQRSAMMKFLIQMLTIHRQSGEIVRAGSRGRVNVWRLPDA